MKVSSKKQKARDLQKLVASLASEYTGIPWGEDEEIASRPMGKSGPDVALSPRARKLFPFSIECKDVQSFSFIKTLQQVADGAYPQSYKLIVYKRSNRSPGKRVPPMAIISLEHFFSLLALIEPGTIPRPPKPIRKKHLRQ